MANETLRKAVLGAQQQGSPASPLGNFPELAKMYSSAFQLPLSNAGTQGQSYNLQAEDANARAAAAQALQEKQQLLKDLQDPSKYQQIPKQDGGYTFLDPTGKEISAFQYSQVTGKTPDKILKDSQNPIDIAFKQDFNQLQSYFQDKANSKLDKTAADRAAATEDIIRKNYGIDLAKQKPQDVVKTFMNSYPTVYGLHTTGVQGTNTLLPNKSALDNYGTSSGGIGG